MSIVNVSWLVWPLIIALPLMLTQTIVPSLHYSSVFPAAWYDIKPKDYGASDADRPSPLGLTLGLLAVVVGQIFTLLYFSFIALPAGKQRAIAELKKQDAVKYQDTAFVAIQKEGARPYALREGIITHLAQPEGFVLLGGYLIGTWMFGWMPPSYYSFAGGINWMHVFQQLLYQDSLQYMMHMIEHSIKGTGIIKFPFTSYCYEFKWPFNLYAVSHKPHHVFTNPRFFDAFNGSVTDTTLMILIPLFMTAYLVDANVWSYMTFGSLYANWLCLIHSEYNHPWDPLFRKLGFGTAADHHVHHKLFTSNFGHLFMYCDWLFGTYRDPKQVDLFNKL